MRIRFILLTLVLLIVAVATVGCGPSAAEVAEEIIEQENEDVIDAEVEGDFNEGVTTIETTRGTTTSSYGDKAEVPKGWPEAMPIYPGTLSMATGEETNDGEITFILSVVTADGSDEVAEWYRRELTDQGWAEVAVQSSADAEGYLISAAHDGWTTAITIGPLLEDETEYPDMTTSINTILTK